MMKLSILIPTTYSRKKMLSELLDHLKYQIDKCGAEDIVQVLIYEDSGEESVGSKRQYLLEMAKGEMVAHIDSDDWVSNDYVELLLEGVESGKDCCSLIGEITTDGKNPKKFIHSLEYNSWFEKDGVYYRPHNHLNCIKREIALQIGFPDKRHGEDYDFSMGLQKSKLIKTEHKIESTIYFYRYVSKK